MFYKAFILLIFSAIAIAANAGVDFTLSVNNKTPEQIETTVHEWQCMYNMNSINNVFIQSTQTYTAKLEEDNSGKCYIGYVCIGTKFFAINIWGPQGNIGQIIYRNDCGAVCLNSMSVHTADPANYTIQLNDNCDSDTDSPSFVVTVTKNP